VRDLEAALKAAGDRPERLLKLLEARDLCVWIQAVLDMAPSTVSKHLTLLKQAGFVADRRDGKWVYYTLVGDARNPYTAGILSCSRDARTGIRAFGRIVDGCVRSLHPVDEPTLPPVADLAHAAPRSSSRRRVESQA
jgi:DNA-binding transcriptional ArsR family regulator